MASSDLKNEITNFLVSKHMPPAQTWLNTFLSTVRPTTPLLATQKTALFRIQAADLTTAVSVSNPVNFFPGDISSPHVKDFNLRGPIAVQILDIEDIGRSRWSQIEALEAQKRGETTKGREIIRVTAEDADPENPSATASSAQNSSGPHKLLLQDAKGVQAYAIELREIPSLNIQTAIGCKLLLKNILVARGVLLLTPDSVEILGGKIEAWDKKWREERLSALKTKAGARDDR